MKIVSEAMPKAKFLGANSRKCQEKDRKVAGPKILLKY